MSEATVVLQEALPKRSDKAPFAAKDGNGEIWKRWDQDFAPLIGKRVKVVYEVKSREFNGRTFQDNIVSEAHELPAAESENGDHPPLGTGEYKRAQAAPTDARRILVCVAWERANELAAIEVRSRPSVQWTPQLIFEAAKAHADNIFVALARKSNPDLLNDEDIPF